MKDEKGFANVIATAPIQALVRHAASLWLV